MPIYAFYFIWFQISYKVTSTCIMCVQNVLFVSVGQIIVLIESWLGHKTSKNVFLTKLWFTMTLVKI